MKQRNDRGFSLFELMVVVALGALILGLAVTGLKKGTTMGGSRGMATAVAAELRLAREKAISKGSPVAVLFHRGVSRSLFTLEGDTDPAVTRVVDYQGDYPQGAMAVVTYPGPNFGEAPELIGSKATAWKERLADWLPNEFQEYDVIFFTPNGSVVSNDLPAADGSYRLVVAMGMELGGRNLAAAGEPYTLAISQTGAVEYEKGLLHGSGGVNTVGASSPASVPAPPRMETSHSPKAPLILHSEVTPPAEEIYGPNGAPSMAHVLDRGEYLTLEVYAKSQDGKPLYAGWLDSPDRGDEFKGRFSIPTGEGGVLRERMEFFPELKVNGKEETDVWRSVWTWTPPHIAEAGDRYSLEADVRDSTFEVQAKVADVEPVLIAAPGEILFESNRNGNWHLYTMMSDGTQIRRLTKGDHDYRFPSVTANGELIAFERNGNEVWVMNVDGTGQWMVDYGRAPTISPIGNAIAYHDRTDDSKLIVRRMIDGSADARIELVTARTEVEGDSDGVGPSTMDNRAAFSRDGRTVFFSPNDGEAKIGAARLRFTPGGGLLKVNEFTLSLENSEGLPNILSTPQVGGLYICRVHNRLYYHADGTDPYVGYVPTALNGTEDGVAVHRRSAGISEAYPAPSPWADLVLLNLPGAGSDSLTGRYHIYKVLPSQFPNSSPGAPISGEQLTKGDSINLRPVWIRQRSGES